MRKDYLTRRFGDLVSEGKLSNGLWRYRCVRVKASGEPCGNVRDLERKVARLYRSCVECAQLAISNGSITGGRPHTLNYKRVRSNFTPHQWKRYHEILRGREGEENEKEAVELVVLEAKHQLPEGACCRLCFENKLLSQVA